MSSHSRLRLGTLHLGSTRNDIDPGLIWMFRPSEKRTELLDNRRPEQLARYVGTNEMDDYDEDNPYKVVEYTCRAAAARDRLDLKGFTFAVATAAFARSVDSEVRRYEAYLRDESREALAELYEERLRALRSLTVDKWLEGLARIKNESLTRYSVGGLSTQGDDDMVLRHMLSAGSHFYGYPGDDSRHVVRLALEGAAEQEPLTYDLSDLVAGGWIGEAEDLVRLAESLMDDDLLLHQRVIVLTEGKTDKRILERSLALFYPHLAEYFHFFDFDGVKVAGGGGQLANLVRAFAAADVRHRILAVFDNDTGGRAAGSSLEPESLPQNIEFRYYPDLELAANYPTIGPSGPAMMDINGMAAGLELYLGEDVLKAEDSGELTPVQWKGYNDKMQTYQGEVADKRGVQERFWRKIERCEADPGEIELHHWDGIRSILDAILTAFHDSDSQRILADTE